MSQFSQNPREYIHFKQMLERALSEGRLPAGIVDSNHIVPGSIRPQDCNMDANWNFRGSISSNGLQLGAQPVKTEVQFSENQNIAEITGRHHVSRFEDTDIFFLDSKHKPTTLLLPFAKSSPGRKLYIKRVDKVVGNICRVLATGNDKVDGTDGVELQSTQAVILIASSSQWHVFSKLD